MGACPPNRVLGALGYVHRHHSQLESISLITDGTCEWNTNGTAPVWLQHLTSLKHLSWRAIFSQSDLGHLRNCLWENYHNLESLELEFFDFAETKRRWAAGSTPDAAPGNFFARDILLIQQNALQTRFPKLHTLSLGTFNWEGHTAELAWAFNVADLRTLRLFNCSETDVLFARVYNACESSGIRLKLTTFEFQDHNRQLHKLYGRPNYFKGFLDMVNSGTENLYIYIPDHALAVIESLIACRDRPRRFVFRVDSWDDEFNDLLNKLQEYVKNPVLEFLGLPGCLLLPVVCHTPLTFSAKKRKETKERKRLDMINFSNLYTDETTRRIPPDSRRTTAQTQAPPRTTGRNYARSCPILRRLGLPEPTFRQDSQGNRVGRFQRLKAQERPRVSLQERRVPAGRDGQVFPLRFS